MARYKRPLAIITVLSILLGRSAGAADSVLLSPFDLHAVRALAPADKDTDFSCKKPPAPPVHLQFFSMYKEGDKSRSIIDPEADATYKKAIAPVASYEKNLSKMANRVAVSARADIASCVLDWMHVWAKASALLGEVNANGQYVRKWVLGTVANSYMQIRDEPTLDATKKADVTVWIRRVGQAAQKDFSTDPDLNSRRNNHLYWAAWGVASAAIAVNDRAMFDWAMEKTRFGIDQIQKNGSLPLELTRRKRAYHYHFYATMPLFLLAEAGHRNGIDLFKYNGEGLKRLAQFNLANLDGDAALIKELTGLEQDKKRTGTPSDLGWLEIYVQHYPDDTSAQTALKKFRPMKASRMGGNITLLYSPAAAQE